MTPPATHQLTRVSTWPAEPEAPSEVDVERFREAVAYVCRRPLAEAPADEILGASREADVEPFLLAALMYERSRCDPKLRTREGTGLLLVHPGLYRSAGPPRPPVHPLEWDRKGLQNPRANLGLGARLLRMWQDSHELLDETFGGAEHRSAVSHFVWGDVVRSSGAEDLVLTTRRRLLARYAGLRDEPQDSPLGIKIVSPLEGAPRVATSQPGADRDGGARRHRGLDLAATIGEPVRAMADGTVIFAGVNLGSRPRYGPISPEKIGKYAKRRLGRGGIYLCIRHDVPEEPEKEIVSCYMHLLSYRVRQDQQVSAGEIIGHVGRTGVKVSPPHLHLELRVNKRATNPMKALASLLIPPKATLTYRYSQRAQRARLRAARAAAAAAASPTPTEGGI